MKPGSPADVAVTLTTALVGAGAVTYGAWLVFPPAAWMFAGGLLLWVSGIGQSRTAPEAPAK